MENYCFGFYFSILDVHFVATQHNWNAFTYSHQISMPIWYIFVSYAASNIKHYNSALTLEENN